MTAALAVTLTLQLRARQYVPGLYWTVVVLVGIVGTLITDNLTDALGVPLELSTAAFTILLAITFGTWWAREHTLSIRSVHPGAREVFYWLAVLCTFALGTAAGDLVAEQLDVGHALSTLLFAAAIVLAALAYPTGTAPRSRRSGPSTSSPARSTPPSATCCRRTAKSAASGSARSSRAGCSSRPSSAWLST